MSTVLPFPSVNIAFMQGGSRITGVTTGKFTYEVRDAGVVVGAMFRPGGFYPYFGSSVSALTDKVAPVDTLFPQADQRYNDAIIAVPEDEDIVRQLEMLLRSKPVNTDPKIDLISDIVAAAAGNPGIVTVGGLARQFALPARSLQHLFRNYVGVGLKWVIMRYRLQEAAELANTEKAPKWARVALDLGYSDQAHFANAFRKIIGQSPTQYAKAIRDAKGGR